MEILGSGKLKGIWGGDWFWMKFGKICLYGLDFYIFSHKSTPNFRTPPLRFRKKISPKPPRLGLGWGWAGAFLKNKQRAIIYLGWRTNVDRSTFKAFVSSLAKLLQPKNNRIGKHKVNPFLIRSFARTNFNVTLLPSLSRSLGPLSPSLGQRKSRCQIKKLSSTRSFVKNNKNIYIYIYIVKKKVDWKVPFYSRVG